MSGEKANDLTSQAGKLTSLRAYAAIFDNPGETWEIADKISSRRGLEAWVQNIDGMRIKPNIFTNAKRTVREISRIKEGDQDEAEKLS